MTDIDELKSHCDIVATAQALGCLPSGRGGNRYQGSCCPGNHGSEGGRCFVIWPDIQSFKCYHCGTRGDVIKLVELANQVDFRAAVDWLADRFGVPRLETKNMSPEERAAYEAQSQERQLLYSILSKAAHFYHETLLQNREMFNHLVEHYGLREETITEYQLGFAVGRGLMEHLEGLGYTSQQVLKTGLFVKTKGTMVEFFIHRLIFPYWKSGDVVYFIGRKTDQTPQVGWESAKYKKLPMRDEKDRPYISELIDNKFFYGEDSVRGADSVFVAEGVTDCLSLLQDRYPTISPLTTRFRREDLPRLLSTTQRASTVYLIPDAEENQAGLNGALDTAAVMEEAGKAVYVVVLPRPEGIEKVDAADFLRDQGKEAFDLLLKEAKTPLQIEIDQVAKENLDPIRLVNRLGEIKERLASLPKDKIEAYLRYLKEAFGVNLDFVKALKTELKKAPKIETAEISTEEYAADLPGLVEIVESDGTPSFLMLESRELEVKTRIDDDGVSLSPPPREAMKWLLPRAEEVMRHYKEDSDRELYCSLVEYFKSISELPSESHYHLLATWSFHTYLCEKSQYSPILWLFAIPERGKTRTGKACVYVARRAIHVESLRDAYLIRVTQNLGATLFFDVLDIWNKAQKAGTEDILLLRYEKGATVPRVLYPDRGPYRDTVYYDIFGPTIVATNVTVSEIYATRAIQIIMPESSRRFENDILPEHGLELKERLTAFRARHLTEELPLAEKPSRGRLGDILRPLRQIIRLVVPLEEGRFLDLCEQIRGERHDNLAETLEGRLVQVILDLEDKTEHGMLDAARIAQKINEGVPEKFQTSQARITRTCKSMGFKCKRPGGKTHVEIESALLAKLRARYLEKSAQSAQTEHSLKDQDLISPGLSEESAQNARSAKNSADTSEKAHSTTLRNDRVSAECSESALFPDVLDDFAAQKRRQDISIPKTKGTDSGFAEEEWGAL